MTLDLNTRVLPYKEFYGKVTKQMPQLVAEGRVPLSVAGLLERRLNSNKQDWKDNYFFTGDAIAYHPDGKCKILLDAPLLRTLTPKSTVRYGAFVLEDGAYETLQGTEFSRAQVKAFLEHDLTTQDVKAHPLWRAVARDQNLLNAYVDAVFPEMINRFQYNRGMSIYVEVGDTMPTIRALTMYGLESRSWLSGRSDLDDGNGRLVGVAPEVRA